MAGLVLNGLGFAALARSLFYRFTFFWSWR